MYLKRVTIAGFKSFAGRVVLDLEPGITAVVGPNGSGKSNIADAIRWALGEQSKARLRLADREEVVFAGTQKRARASYAEVTLLFDNQDGVFPLEFTEVEMSRRLYRSGETDYRLGGRSVRLSDIQQLLAEAGLGANTYAVIGQGMIDGFLLSGPAERKLLFDEAAGIRAPELRRESALRKLAATEANLTRLRDIHAELEPRLAGLQRAAVAADEQRALEAELRQVRAELVAAAAAQLRAHELDLRREREELTARLHRLRHEQRALEREQQARLAAARMAEEQRAERGQEIRRLEAEYEHQVQTTAGLRSRCEHLEQSLEQRAGLHRRETATAVELGAAEVRLGELADELAMNQAAADRAANAVERADQVVARVQGQLVEIRQSVSDGTQQQYVSHALSVLKTIARGLDDTAVTPEQLRLLVHKVGRLLSHAAKTGEAEMLQQIRDMQARLEAAMTRRDTAVEHQTNITIMRRSLEIDLAHQQTARQQLQMRLAEVRAELAAVATDRQRLSAALGETQAAEVRLGELRHDLEERRAQLAPEPAVGGAAVLIEAAAQLERRRSEQGAAELRLAAVRQELSAVAVDRRRYEALARTWHVGEPAQAATADGPATRGAAGVALEAADLAELEHRQERLATELAMRQELQQAGAAELTAVGQRSDELATQIGDLEQAKTDLDGVVVELDRLIRERFRENFAALSEQFGRYFGRLFGGGTAALELTEQEDGKYGILIKATPKGKRLASLSALSGGERAMAGVALLAAILSVNPSPFVVLDEVDAALDEANSGRLAGILEELAGRSQLVVITHNRQTMKAARVLFGVTMNEYHVSRLLSLRLEEASRLAAR